MKLTFIGLGMMGQPMARRLIGHGFDLRVSDVNAALAAEFGAAWGGTPREAATGADVVITMLPTGQVVRDVLLGQGDVASVLKPGTIVIDCSSSEAGGTVQLGADLKQRGIGLVDAPVSGGVPLAREGKLTLMVGGTDQALLVRLMPIFECLGARVVPVALAVSLSNLT